MVFITHQDVFWVVSPCSDAIGYQHFRGTSRWRWRHQDPLKHWYSTATLHSIITKKTLMWIFTSHHIQVQSDYECHTIFNNGLLYTT